MMENGLESALASLVLHVNDISQSGADSSGSELHSHSMHDKRISAALEWVHTTPI